MRHLDALGRKLEIDQVVLLMLSARVWQGFAGPLTLVLIAKLVSPEIQGYYYTFASLIATQTFVELGLSIVILNIASHEGGKITFGVRGELRGDVEAVARVVGLGRFIARWYSAAAFVFVVLAGVLGFYFFDSTDNISTKWAWPWVCIVLISGAQFLLTPFNSLLEGCGHVLPVSRFRLWQGIASSIVLWLTLMLWADLWVPVASSFALLAINGIFLFWRYPLLFTTLFNRSLESALDWRGEVWPMQWRFALMGMVNFFIYSLFTPVIFQYHGAAEAGKIGMTIQMLYMLQAAALAWVQSKVPLFGTLIALRSFNELDRIWLKLSGISVAAMVTGGLVLELGLLALLQLDADLASRLLGPGPTFILLLGVCSLHAVACMAMYLRAHKREPLTWIGVISGICCGLLVWQLGKAHGVIGAAVAYTSVVTLFNLPAVSYVWFRSRRLWH